MKGQEAFFDAVRDLYLHAGKPSTRNVAAEIGGMSHSTVHALVTGQKVPSWPVVSKIVSQLGGDVERFRHLWVAAKETENPRLTELDRADISVFVSYAHVDDDATYGRVSKLVDDIAKSYRSLTGQAVSIFKDTDSLQLGDDWKDRIRLGLSTTSIFLAVVSPAYMRSSACREELIEFLGFLDISADTRLIIPIFFADHARMNDMFESDLLWQRIQKLQGLHAGNMRSADPGSADWIQSVEKIVHRVDSVLADLAKSESVEGAQSDSGRVEESDQGSLERLAEIEDTSEHLAGDLETFTRQLEELQAVMVDNTPKMRKAKTFGQKLAVSRQIAGELEPISDEMVRLSDEIANNIDSWTFVVNFALESVQKGTGSRPNKNLIGFFRSIRQLAETGVDALSGLDHVNEVINGGIGFSRDLDKPLKKMQRSFLRMIDLRGTFNSWLDALDALESIPSLAKRVSSRSS